MGLNDEAEHDHERRGALQGRGSADDGARGELREIRGNDIAMIFQDPMTSLNPVHTIGRQLVEAIQLHQDVSKKVARAPRASSC